jgi:hypothetical protein
MAAHLRDLGWGSLVHEAGQKDYNGCQVKGEHNHGWLLTSEIWDGVPWPMRVGRKITMDVK